MQKWKYETMDSEYDCTNPSCRAESMKELLHEWDAEYDWWSCPNCGAILFSEPEEEKQKGGTMQNQAMVELEFARMCKLVREKITVDQRRTWNFTITEK